jgi:hypothetical protein
MPMLQCTPELSSLLIINYELMLDLQKGCPKAGGMVECLPSKCEALSSNFSTARNIAPKQASFCLAHIQLLRILTAHRTVISLSNWKLMLVQYYELHSPYLNSSTFSNPGTHPVSHTAPHCSWVSCSLSQFLSSLPSWPRHLMGTDIIWSSISHLMFYLTAMRLCFP